MIELTARSGSPHYAFVGLHGAFLDARSLLEIGTILAAEGDGVLLDLAGHGEALEVAATGLSFEPESLGSELLARPELIAWLQALPPDLPLVLLGHSLGALIAIWLAGQGPLKGRVARLILLEPLLAIDLSVPGQGEFLFGLGVEMAQRGYPRRSILETAEDWMVNRLVTFFVDGLFRLPLLGEPPPYRRWIRELLKTTPCDVVCGLRHHVVPSTERTLLDIGTLVGPGHLPLDRPLLRLHAVADAGHRLDTSAATRRVIAELVPQLGSPSPAQSAP